MTDLPELDPDLLNRMREVGKGTAHLVKFLWLIDRVCDSFYAKDLEVQNLARLRFREMVGGDPDEGAEQNAKLLRETYINVLAAQLWFSWVAHAIESKP